MKLRRLTAFFSAFFIISFACNFSFASAQGKPDVSAVSAALMVVDTGELLFEKDAYTRRPMASTTKIMTSLIALEEQTPQREITVSADMIQVEGTSMGLLDGDSVTLKTLVYGMLLQSGNDAANVTAIAVGESVENFVRRMNERAREIGMKDTVFETPSGLDSENHASTAYDMALLGCTAMKNPEFVSICSQRSAAVYYGNPPYRRTLTNHNRLLWSYEGAIGIKTGFTKKSGRCLVSAAERDGVCLVAVTLNAPNDWNDHKAMFDYGFSIMERRQIDYDISSLFLKVTGGERDRVGVELAEPPTAVMHRDDDAEIRQEIFIKRFEYAPVEKGKIVGEAHYYDGDSLLCTVPILTAEESVRKKIEEPKQPEKQSFFRRLIEKIRSFF